MQKKSQYTVVRLFQSTLPARGATWVSVDKVLPLNNFNPRSPHGERLRNAGLYYRSCNISIHAPRTGSDGTGANNGASACAFQSTLPARGATAITDNWRWMLEISIHAPRTGSDFLALLCRVIRADFNPRSPHGERQNWLCGVVCGVPHFNPRSPHGERRRRSESPQPSTSFQSTLPARGATPPKGGASDA